MEENAPQISICRDFNDLRSFLSSSLSLKSFQEGLQIGDGWTAASIVEWLQEVIKLRIVVDALVLISEIGNSVSSPQ